MCQVPHAGDTQRMRSEARVGRSIDPARREADGYRCPLAVTLLGQILAWASSSSRQCLTLAHASSTKNSVVYGKKISYRRRTVGVRSGKLMHLIQLRVVPPR